MVCSRNTHGSCIGLQLSVPFGQVADGVEKRIIGGGGDDFGLVRFRVSATFDRRDKIMPDVEFIYLNVN